VEASGDTPVDCRPVVDVGEAFVDLSLLMLEGLGVFPLMQGRTGA
jgi:hypothetical protein